jgi:hypothetical protein
MADLIRTLFDSSWDELSRAEVETFLHSAEDEGLTWEVKGDQRECKWPRRAQVEKAVCGFANSQLGGVLIIGAHRADKRKPGWALHGLSDPGEEVDLALDRVIRNGIRPVPPFRVKSWLVEASRYAAVVWVEPTDRPPSITRDGRVFERTTGATEPVDDPVALAKLFDAGAQAISTAKINATQAATRALMLPHVPSLSPQGFLLWEEAEESRPWIGLGVAATTYRGDIGGRLVEQVFAEEAERTIRELLRPSPHNYPLPDQAFITPWGDVVAARVDPSNPSDHRRHYFVSVGWDGGVGVACLDLAQSRPGPSWSEEVLKPMWDLACRLVLLLGGTGQLHMSLHGTGWIGGGQAWPDLEHAREAVTTASGDESATTFTVPKEAVDDLELQLRRYAGEQLWK